MSVTLTRQQALNMFKKIGAEIEEGGKHLKVKLVVNGKYIFMIPISNGSKDIPTGTAHKIFREAGVFRRDHCEALRNCPLSKQEYLSILRTHGIL